MIREEYGKGADGARSDRLSPEELGLLAKQLASASDEIEAARIKERLTRGFYYQDLSSARPTRER